MPGRIFLLQDDESLVPMNETAYAKEDLLQGLLAKYPDLLAGEQINPDNPRRWLLISREYAVPSEEDGPGRWSLDHLFLDHEGVPTLVEVKRGANNQIRREVVGQMLDYASNAVAYWTVEMICEKFNVACEYRAEDPTELVRKLLAIEQPIPVESEIEAFWGKVKTNLQAGNIRLVFVADSIPPELQRIVEFLNQQMDPAEVLAVEVRQFIGANGLRTLVPRLIGQISRKKKSVPTSSSRRDWSEELFFEELEAQAGSDAVIGCKQLLVWVQTHFDSVNLTGGGTNGRYTPNLEHAGRAYEPISIWSDGRILVRFKHLRDQPPFDSDDYRRQLLSRLRTVPGVNLSEDNIHGVPTCRLAELTKSQSIEQFASVLQWFIDEVRKTPT